VSRRRHLARLAGSTGLVTMLVATLAVLGRHRLTVPPYGQPSTVASWIRAEDPAVVAMSVVWTALLAFGAYVVLVAALHLAAELLRSRPLDALATVVTLPVLRRGLTAMAGVSLVATTSLTPGRGATTAEGGPGTASMHRLASVELDAVAAGTASMRRLGPGADTNGTATMHPLPSDGPRTDEPPPERSLQDDLGAGRVPAPSPTTAVVRPGDSFWSIAASALAASWGRPPTDAEIVPYWLALIDANHALLADPANPSLLFTGQQLRLPPTAGEP
jgi:nucleoid-associated protein YgaU